MMDSSAKIFVAGHRGLVGSALVRALQGDGFQNLVTRTRAELDLRDTASVNEFFRQTRPAYVFLAAARVGGIVANNTFPAEFITENLQVQTAVIDAAHRFGVKKLLFLGSSCIYPKFAEQPIREEALLTGALEPTNEAYAIAKIAGLEMLRAYRRQYGFNGISVMPTNLYGPGDNFDLASSHVLPALVRKFHDGKHAGLPSVTLWGTGRPRREFLHVDDMARACVFLMNRYDDEQFLNVGVGEDLSIAELAATIRDVVGYRGEFLFDTSKPDGTPRKVLDISRLHGLGWRAEIGLRDGIASTYRWYLENTVRTASDAAVENVQAEFKG